ncbi:MAG: TetR/AcrR family transcriptional regulator, partial [Alphaproteobacteria bacterium]
MSQTQSISTRQSLLGAAIPEFWEHGYRGASIRKICTRAGASANAITYHFGSKEKLYQEILDQFAALQLAQVDSVLLDELRSQEEFEIRLEMFLTQLLEAYLNNRESLLIALREFEQLSKENDDGAVREIIKRNHAISTYIQKAKDKGFVGG